MLERLAREREEAAAAAARQQARLASAQQRAALAVKAQLIAEVAHAPAPASGRASPALGLGPAAEQAPGLLGAGLRAPAARSAASPAELEEEALHPVSVDGLMQSVGTPLVHPIGLGLATERPPEMHAHLEPAALAAWPDGGAAAAPSAVPWPGSTEHLQHELNRDAVMERDLLAGADPFASTASLSLVRRALVCARKGKSSRPVQRGQALAVVMHGAWKLQCPCPSLPMSAMCRDLALGVSTPQPPRLCSGVHEHRCAFRPVRDAALCAQREAA